MVFSAKRSASVYCVTRPWLPASGKFLEFPRAAPCVDASALRVRSEISRLSFSASCRVDVQHERIGIGSEFSHHEGHALRHQARNERNVAREAVELGYDDWAFGSFRGCERSGKLWPAI
jgi:hypothetical protein